MKDDADKFVSHFGCMLHPAREAEGAARAGRLCDYVVLKRWKNGERDRTFEYALTSDPGNYFYWNWLHVRVVEMKLRELAREALGDSTKREVWADKVEAALGTCLIAEIIPELLKFVQDILPKVPLLQVRALWECTSNSIMIEDNFAIGGGKTPRQTKSFKDEHLSTYRPLVYLVDYITPTWENDRGVWLSGADVVDHYYDSPQQITDLGEETASGNSASGHPSSISGHQRPTKPPDAPPQPSGQPPESVQGSPSEPPAKREEQG